MAVKIQVLHLGPLRGKCPSSQVVFYGGREEGRLITTCQAGV